MPDTPENAQDDISTALGELAAAARKMAASQPGAVAASVAGQAARGEKREENIAERLARQSTERAWGQVPPAGNDVGTGQPLPVIPKDMDFAAFQAQQRAARGEVGPPKPEGVAQKPPQTPLDAHLRERYPDRGDKWYQAVQQKAASGQQGPPRPDLSKPEYGDLDDDETPRTDRPQPAPVDLLDHPPSQERGTYGFADGGEAKAAADPPQQHESIRLLTEIRDGIRALTKRAATGEAKPAKDPNEPGDEEKEKSSTLFDMFQASPLAKTKIGHLVTRGAAIGRLAKKLFPKTFGGGKSPASPPTGGNDGGKPPKVPPGGNGKGGIPAPGGKGKKPTGLAALPTGAKVAAVAVGATAALVALGKAAVYLGYQMEGEARRLAEVSPSQAANVTILDAQRTVRDFEKGEATAGSSGQLLETLNRLEKAAQPFLVASTNVMNTFTANVIDPIADLVEVAGDALTLFKKIVPGADALLGGPPNDQGELLGRFLDAVHKDQQKKAQDAQNRMNAARNVNPRRLP